MTHPPPRKLPPIRMGDRSDQVRSNKAQAAEKHQAEAKIRTRIYQDILALLDIAERLTLDLSSHEDRYGLEWNALAKQIYAQYNADVVKTVPGFQAKIMSKEGAHGLPQGLYRNLLDFGEECAAFMKRARSIHDANSAVAFAPQRSAGTRGESPFMQACQQFKKACTEMRQQICIFENERKAGEESFFR
jgi:hypothetical protein